MLALLFAFAASTRPSAHDLRTGHGFRLRRIAPARGLPLVGAHAATRCKETVVVLAPVITGSRHSMNAATPIDLRSDTVTRPTPEMRSAIAAAPVGDDQYGDDPTVNALQERVAELLGKEAALWLPSGTMANQVALRTLTRPGDEVVASRESHVGWHE